METKKKGRKPLEDRTKVKKGLSIYLSDDTILKHGGNEQVKRKIYNLFADESKD